MTESLRVLHVIPAVAPRYGGPSTAIVSMCDALVHVGLDPVIVTTDADGLGRLDVPFGDLTRWQGIPARFFRRNFSESFKYSRGLAAWLRANVAGFDVVHIHAVLSHAPLAAAAACRRAGIPYVVRPLGTIAPWSLKQKTWRKRIVLACGGSRLLRGAAAVHYTSKEEQAGAERAFGLEHGVVIPLGIDPERLAEPLMSAVERRRDPYVLALSRLHPKKNLDTLIRSFIEIIDSHPAWRLVIAGSGDDRYARSLEQLVADRGASDRVSFAGWVDGEKKRALIRHASVFAMPSLHENFGVSLVEALAAGVPGLVSRHVELARAVDAAGAGWIVDSDEESVGRGLRQALDDDAVRERKGVAARELARRFAWPDVAVQLRDLYSDLRRGGVSRSVAVGVGSAVSVNH